MNDFEEKLSDLEQSLLDIQDTQEITTNSLSLPGGFQLSRTQLLIGIATPIITFCILYFIKFRLLTVKKNGKRKISIMRVLLATTIISFIIFLAFYYMQK